MIRFSGGHPRGSLAPYERENVNFFRGLRSEPALNICGACWGDGKFTHRCGEDGCDNEHDVKCKHCQGDGALEIGARGAVP